MIDQATREDGSFSHPRSYAEIAGLILELASSIYAVKERQTPGKNVDQLVPDARRMALMNCYLFVSSTFFQINILSRLETREISAEVFKRLIGLVEGDLRKAVEGIESTAKMALPTLCLFQLENLFRNLLRALGVQPPKGYYNLCKELLARVSVDDPGQKLKELQIGAYIRNSSHANGVHHNRHERTLIFLLRGVEFRFYDGSVIMCAGWGHLFLALIRTFEIVEEILSSPEVASIPEPIRDEFSSAMRSPGP
jgi:hypothetical protein